VPDEQRSAGRPPDGAAPPAPDQSAPEPATPETPAPSGPRDLVRTRALVVCAVVLVGAALRATEPVTLPLVVAVFLLAVVRPLQCAVERRTTRAVAVLAATLAVLLGAAAVVSGFALSIGQIAGRGPEVVERGEGLVEALRRWAESFGIPVPLGGGGGGDRGGQLSRLLGRALAAGGVTLERLGLILGFFVLGLLEVGTFRAKARERLRPPRGEALVLAAEDIAHRVRRFLGALTVTSFISGVATALFTLAVGLDSPLTWGLAAFLLNYVPTIGPFVAVIPPTLYALLQFGGVTRPAIVLFGVGAIQFVIGNFVDPKIEGRALSLSPLVVLVSVVFWGWLWGVLGALLAVPLTVALVAVSERFERTRWVATLLSERERTERR
jgi:predicted PurR-regulated permease PerM